MALPATLDVSLDFSSGATFGIGLTLDDPVFGLLDTGILSESATPSLIADLTSVTRVINIRRGRNLTRDTYEAGVATVRIFDPNSYFNPQNTSSPYYGQLTPLKKLRISAAYAGNTYYLFSGYTTDYVYSYDQAENVSYVTINASDAFRLFNLAAITTITGQANGQDTGTRINKILDTVDFPTSMRSISTGDSLTQADAGDSRTSLSAIKNAEFSEQGAYYLSPEGNAIFKNRSEVISSAGVSPIAFNQTGGIPYKNLKFAFDDKLIVNQANITRLGGTTQVNVDADSVATYFPHSITSSDLVIQTDADAANIAAIYVATRSDTTIRIDEMTLDLLDPNVPTATILGMDYFTNVLITNIQPDGSTITKNLQVQGVAWDITPSSWLGTFSTQETLVDGFILDNTYYGQLNDDILSY
jgi:hypothetical protein